MSLPEDYIYALCDFETTGVDTAKDEPLEVALLFCDHRMDVVRAFESLIRYELPVDIEGVAVDPDHYRDAEKIHGIPLESVGDAPKYYSVARSISDICEDLREPPFRTRRIVLLSDNIQFEWQFMQKVFKTTQWPFHYCGWDSSLLLEATGVGDPEPVHRAMADVGRLHTALCEALRRLDS